MTTNIEKKNNPRNTIEWSYCKVAFLLDYEEVIWPMCEAVKRADIWEPADLVKAVTSGAVKEWPKVTKRGIKDLFRVLRNQCKVDAATLMEAAKLYA